MKVKGSLWSCLRVKNCSFRTHSEVLECSVMCVQLSANRCNSSQHCANGCNNSQQCWDLQCIMGRIQPIRLWRPCVMYVHVPNNVGKAVQTDPTLLRYASAITEQIRMLKSCWPCLKVKKLVSNFAQQLPTTRNNRVCKRMHTVKSNNVGSCWPTMLHAFAWGFKGIKSNKNDVIWSMV